MKDLLEAIQTLEFANWAGFYDTSAQMIRMEDCMARIEDGLTVIKGHFPPPLPLVSRISFDNDKKWEK